MIVKYRLIEKYFPGRGWSTWGVLYENVSGLFPDCKVLYRAIPDDDKHVRRFFDARISQQGIGLDDGERIVGEQYAGRFRVLLPVRTAEGEDYQEIRARLWDIIFEEMERRRPRVMVKAVEYTVPEPAYVALREGSEEED